MSEVFFTDSHAHIDWDSYDSDRDNLIARAKAAGVKRIVNIALGPEPEKWERAFRLFAGRADIPIAVGVHPHDAAKMTDETLGILRSYAKRPEVVALGEIGLDYYYSHSPHDVQVQRFGEMLDLALELQLPVTIHSRDAFEDTSSQVKNRDVFRKVGGVMHCFTGSLDEARAFLDLGAYISFSGIITFKKSEALRDVVRFVPIDRMLIETDAPFLAPEPHRGKRNEPAFVVRVAETVAGLKGLSVDDVAAATTANTEKVFSLKGVGA